MAKVMALENLIRLVTRGGHKQRTWQELCHDVLRLQDDATGLRLAAELLQRYSQFDEDETLAFFQFLLHEFRVDHDALRAAIAAYDGDPSPTHVQQVNRASLPSRRKLFELLNMCPGGMAHLLAMREAVLRLRRIDPELAAVDSDLEILFRNWFNRGLLTLQRIDWNTPAFVLEKLFKYEAVHEISGWDDLKQRLSQGRRWFFHPVLPDEPIIFVQVVLSSGLLARIGDVLGEAAPVRDEATADTAIFYSISNCQQGLKGIAFGDLLIKQVVDLISQELPGIRQFATLSPVPGFARWLQGQLDSADGDVDRLLTTEQTAMLRTRLAEADWHHTEHGELQTLLPALCAHYLTSTGKNGRPLDPVARFHLRNGAVLERINWLGDASPKGLREAHGLLVNYLYDLATVTENHEKFVYDQVLTASSHVTELARKLA